MVLCITNVTNGNFTNENDFLTAIAAASTPKTYIETAVMAAFILQHHLYNIDLYLLGGENIMCSTNSSIEVNRTYLGC